MTTTPYAADRTALLIVDPYNDFMSEGGKFYEAIRKTAEAVGDGRTWLRQLHHFVTRAAWLWRPACRGAGRGANGRRSRSEWLSRWPRVRGRPCPRCRLAASVCRRQCPP